MKLHEVLATLGIKNTPEIWQRHWEGAKASFKGTPFLEEVYIREANQLMNLSEERVNMLCETAAFFKSTPEGQGFLWLWHYVLFHSGEEVTSTYDWDVPEALPQHLHAMPHALILLGAIPALQDYYNKKGIPTSVMVDTLRDVTVVMDEHRVMYGHCGVGNYRMWWMHNHFTGKIFWLGRLQYIYKPDDCLLDVHIPGYGPMSHKACTESYKQALEFYAKYFPEYEIKGFICHSWLLSPHLKKILPPESNIIRFQSEYTIHKTLTEDRGIYEYIFKVPEGKELPQDTSLQRAVKKLLDEGGHIGLGEGIRGI